MNKGLKTLLAVVLATVLLLIVLEVISRAVLVRIYNRSIDKTMVVDSVFNSSSAMKANVSGMLWGKSFHTDEWGYRKQRKAVNKNKKSWLVIGDSVTEGVGGDDSSTFCNLLGKQMDSFNVLNESFIGWSVNDYWNVVQAKVDSDTTANLSKVLVVLCLNDIYGESKTGALPMMGTKPFISSINACLQDHYSTYRLLKLLVYQNSDSYFRYDAALYKDTKRVIDLTSTLVKMKERCGQYHVCFEVVIVPYRSQLQHPERNFPQQQLRYYLGLNGIPFLDLLPCMKGLKKVESFYLFGDEIHFSTAGHRAVAACLQRSL